jgi:hypothetical protein
MGLHGIISRVLEGPGGSWQQFVCSNNGRLTPQPAGYRSVPKPCKPDRDICGENTVERCVQRCVQRSRIPKLKAAQSILPQRCPWSHAFHEPCGSLAPPTSGALATRVCRPLTPRGTESGIIRTNPPFHPPRWCRLDWKDWLYGTVSFEDFEPRFRGDYRA